MLSVNNLSKSFCHADGRQQHILNQLNFTVKAGEFVAILGKSGCGKTTFLKCLSGMSTFTSGERIAAESLRSGYVFQEPRLLPWYNVEQNLQLAFNKKQRRSRETKIAIKKSLALTELSEYRSSYPDQLSGGLAQRAAISRALCRQPDILFMDEPFSALDALTRTNMQQELKRIQQQTGCAVVFITHDVNEAVNLADRILVMQSGHFSHEYFPQDTAQDAAAISNTIITESFI